MDLSLKGMDTSFLPVKVTSFADAVSGVARRREESAARWPVVEDVLEEMLIPCSEELWDASFRGDFAAGAKWWNICLRIDVEEAAHVVLMHKEFAMLGSAFVLTTNTGGKPESRVMRTMH